MIHFHFDRTRLLIAVGITFAGLLGIAGHETAAFFVGLAANHLWIWGD